MGLPSKVYAGIIGMVDPIIPKFFKPFWEHPAGPKTIFFWAPLFKWGLVVAGFSDMKRPAENLSVNQSASIAMTGFIWSRWSLIIIPKNWNLFAVNMFVGFTQLYQLYRALDYQQNKKKLSESKGA